MPFKVPQYIEVEDKILGPFTFKQFIYVGGAAAISFVLFRLLPSFLSFPLIGGVALLGWALAFYPKQKLGKPFIEIIEAAFKYMMRGQLYTWKKSPPKLVEKKEEVEIKNTPVLSVPHAPGGGLSNKLWDLEIGTEERKVEEGREVSPPIEGEMFK